MVAAIRHIDALRFEPTSELALFHIASPAAEYINKVNISVYLRV